MLTAEYYGSEDLVDLGLFHESHHVQTAMRKGELKFHRVNKETTFMTKDLILEYWKEHRSRPFENATQRVAFYCTPSEQETMKNIVEMVQRKVDSRFTEEDLFRNTLQYLCEGTEKGSIPLQNNKFFKVNT